MLFTVLLQYWFTIAGRAIPSLRRWFSGLRAATPPYFYSYRASVCTGLSPSMATHPSVLRREGPPYEKQGVTQVQSNGFTPGYG
jgi:hypothetical protein